MKKKNIKNGVYAISLTLIFLFCGSSIYAQSDIGNDNLNLISDNAHTLDPVMKSLSGLESKQSQSVVSFIHIGDSHMQAGFISKKIRLRLQETFGNAGRGLIVPIRLIKSNEPYDYNISSPNTWQGGRCAVRRTIYPYGISGFAIQTYEPNHQFSLTPKSDSLNGINYSFNKVIVFHRNNCLLNAPQDLEPQCKVLSPEAYAISFCHPVPSVCLSSSADSDNSVYTYHAFSLENGKPGILYHSIGVNGATFNSYNDLDLFFEQSAVLQPQVIIISLGTNEAFAARFNKDTFFSSIDKMISGLKAKNPNAVIILTTPAEDFKRLRRKRKAPNQRIEEVAQAIVDYADSHGIAYWDLFNITGGKGSARKWSKHGLMAGDMVHFNRAGYEIQGDLFTDAFLKLYYDRKQSGSK